MQGFKRVGKSGFCWCLSFAEISFCCRWFGFCLADYSQDISKDAVWRGLKIFWQWPWEPRLEDGDAFLHGFTLITDELCTYEQLASLGQKPND